MDNVLTDCWTHAWTVRGQTSDVLALKEIIKQTDYKYLVSLSSKTYVLGEKGQVLVSLLDISFCEVDSQFHWQFFRILDLIMHSFDFGFHSLYLRYCDSNH